MRNLSIQFRLLLGEFTDLFRNGIPFRFVFGELLLYRGQFGLAALKVRHHLLDARRGIGIVLLPLLENS